MSPAPRFVMHDDLRWRVVATTDIDGEPGYQLHRGISYLFARVSDCKACEVQIKPIVRRFKGDDHVLEYNGRTMTIRKCRSSKRWPVSLAGIYSAAVKAAVAAEKFAKKKARGKITVKRGNLR